MGRRSMAALSLLAAISLLCACGISGDSQEGTTAGSATTAGGDPATGSSATAGGDATAGPSDAGDASGPSPTENVGNAGFSSLIEMTGKGTEFFDAYESLMQKDAIAYGVTHISFSSRMTLLSYSATLNDYVGDGSGHKCVVVKTLEEDGLFGQLAGDVETVTMRYDLGSGRMDYIIEVTRDGAPGAV
ncbi:MAG: hypothetical protein FWE70_05095, partial [Oscillospiraceae bacterium]|nr:hypothetical protein [Oscillospiraceae bacterium]